MRQKRADLIVNPHGGRNLACLPEILSIFSSAGRDIRLKLKESGGQPQMLAQEAALAVFGMKSE